MRALFELTISRTSSNEASSFPPTLSFKRKIMYTGVCIILEISKQRVKRGWKYLGIWSSLWIRVSNILFRFRVQSEFLLLLVGESGKTRMHEPGNQVKNGPVSPSNDLSKALENTRGESARDACISLEFIDDPVALTPSQPLPALSKSLLDSGPLDRSSSSLSDSGWRILPGIRWRLTLDPASIQHRRMSENRFRQFPTIHFSPLILSSFNPSSCIESSSIRFWNKYRRNERETGEFLRLAYLLRYLFRGEIWKIDDTFPIHWSTNVSNPPEHIFSKRGTMNESKSSLGHNILIASFFPFPRIETR